MTRTTIVDSVFSTAALRAARRMPGAREAVTGAGRDPAQFGERRDMAGEERLLFLR
jgi:hypothetical protein